MSEATVLRAPTRELIETLVHVRSDVDACVSLYMPTGPCGDARKQSSIRLRNLVRDAAEKLERRGWDRRRRTKHLEAADDLVDDPAFWHGCDMGLAVLLDERDARACLLPYPVPEAAYVGNRFVLSPLLPAVTDRVDCHLLTLSQASVRLFRTLGDSLEPIELGDAVTSGETLAAFIDGEKTLQCHTGAPRFGGAHQRAAVFHGQGAGRDLADTRLREFLTLLDREVLRLRRDEPAHPLVPAGDERVVAAFRAVTRCDDVTEAGLTGNVEHLTVPELVDRLRPIRAGIARRRRSHLLEQYRHAAAHDRASTDLDVVGTAASGGQVELLIAPGPHRSGASVADEDLPRVERAIVDTLATSGSVLVVPPDEMPDGAAAAAILRPGAEAEAFVRSTRAPEPHGATSTPPMDRP